MNELFDLNKKFIINSYLWISGILTLIFSTYLFFFHSEVQIKWILIIYSLSILVLPLFILSVWISDWFRKRRYKNKILSNKPFSDLEKIGFNRKIIRPNHNSLKDYVSIGEINDYQLSFDIDINKPKIAEFTIYILEKKMDFSESLKTIKEFKSYDLDFRFYGVTKKINTKKEILNSHQELEKILTEFTHIVRKLKYEPIPLTE